MLRDVRSGGQLTDAAKRISRRLIPARELGQVSAIWLATHHKGGTVWLRRHVTALVYPEGWRVRRISSDAEVYHRFGASRWKLHGNVEDWRPKKCTVVLDMHSAIRVPAMRGLRAVHLVRDPRQIVRSGVLYHRNTHESWANQPSRRLNGRTYREIMNTLDDERALLFELDFIGPTLAAMERWNSINPNVTTVRFEDCLAASGTELVQFFYEICDRKIEPDAIQRRLESVSDQNEIKLDSRRPIERRHFSSNLGKKPDWTDEAEKTLVSRYPKLLQLYGYGSRTSEPRALTVDSA